MNPYQKDTYLNQYLFWIIDRSDIKNNCVKSDAIYVFAKCVKFRDLGLNSITGIPDCKIRVEYSDLETEDFLASDKQPQIADEGMEGFLKRIKKRTFFTAVDALAAKEERDYLIRLAEKEAGVSNSTTDASQYPLISTEQV
jgi:hypothetical protein